VLMSKTQVSSHTALIVVALFLGATVYAYAVSDEIRSASGRSFMIFTVSLAMVLLSFSFMASQNRFVRKLAELFTGVGCVSTFMWFNVLVFDIFWTFKNFRAQTDSLQRFKFYCMYAFGLPLMTFLVIILFDMFYREAQRFVVYFVGLMFYGSCALGIFYLFVTGYLIFQISKTSNGNEHSLFVTERNR
jgi:hypothetical protein